MAGVWQATTARTALTCSKAQRRPSKEAWMQKQQKVLDPNRHPVCCRMRQRAPR